MRDRLFEEDCEAMGKVRLRMLWRKEKNNKEMEQKNSDKIRMIFEG